MIIFKIALLAVFMASFVIPVMAEEFVGYVLESDVMDTSEGEIHFFKMDGDGAFFLDARG